MMFDAPRINLASACVGGVWGRVGEGGQVSRGLDSNVWVGALASRAGFCGMEAGGNVGGITYMPG